jgi:hypothetical protein
MKKTTTLTLGSLTALAGIHDADAAILYFDINPDANIPNFGFFAAGDVNLTTETYTFGSLSGNAFGFSPVNLGMYWAGSIYNAQGGYGASQLAYGDLIDASRTWGFGGMNLVGPSSPYWVDGANSYVGLRLDAGGGDYNYGWVNLTFTAFNGAVVTGFAFEKDLNTAILAGDTGSAAVPEPGQVASSILLLAGIAGYLAYRRRMGAATEPDALHKLALGSRGIADFRADKAA